MLIGLLALVIIASVAVGAVTATFSCCECALQPTTPGVEATDAVIVWEIRFGRVLSRPSLALAWRCQAPRCGLFPESLS